MKEKYNEEYAFRKGYSQGQEEGFDKGFIKGLYQLLSGDMSYTEAYNRIMLFFGYDFAEANAGNEYDIKALFANMNEDPNKVLYAYDRFDAGYHNGYNQAIFDIDSHSISDKYYLECIEEYCNENNIDYDRGDNEEDYDCFEHCDMYDIGFKQGYQLGYEDCLEEQSEVEYPEEIYLDAVPYNRIEAIKDIVREIIRKLPPEAVGRGVIDECWSVVDQLITLEKYLAGNEVLAQYLKE